MMHGTHNVKLQFCVSILLVYTQFNIAALVASLTKLNI